MDRSETYKAMCQDSLRYMGKLVRRDDDTFFMIDDNYIETISHKSCDISGGSIGVYRDETYQQFINRYYCTTSKSEARQYVIYRNCKPVIVPEIKGYILWSLEQLFHIIDSVGIKPFLSPAAWADLPSELDTYHKVYLCYYLGRFHNVEFDFETKKWRVIHGISN